jgi:hypothetical protein
MKLKWYEVRRDIEHTSAFNGLLVLGYIVIGACLILNL